MTGATEFESKDELRQLTELGKHILRRRNSKYKGPAGNKLGAFGVAGIRPVPLEHSGRGRSGGK